MGLRRRLIAGAALAAACTAGWVAAPRTFVVEGVSMGPGLLPGDRVRTGLFPVFDRLRRPRRFERWVLAATDGLAVKRVVGLPGERVSIAGGDLTIDGAEVLKGPRLLAEMGSVVPDDPAAGTEPDDEWSWSRPAGEILDDATFDTGPARILVPVRDAGLAAIVSVAEASVSLPATLRLRVGDKVILRSLAEPGRHAIVAGRLDGRLVASTWRIPDGARTTGPRGCLPVGATAAWHVADPWPGPVGAEAAPALAVGGDGRVAVVEAVRWRDVAWRPGADGTASWRLGVDEILVLGDNAAASNDSRRWGPIDVAALRHRVATGHP